MSKKNLDIFKISIYQGFLRNYKYNLRSLEKYLTIYRKFDGYYSKTEIKYIFTIIISQLDELLKGNISKEFIPIKINNEIHKFLIPIKSFISTENYDQIIKNYTKIFSLINIEKELNNQNYE